MKMELHVFWMKRLEREASKLSANTIMKHKAIANKVKQFDDKATLSDVNLMWLMDLEAWLIERGNSKNTIATTMSALKSTVRQAVNFDLIEKDPFAKYVIRKGQTYEKALDIDDVKQLEQMELSGKDAIVRDAWMFSFYCAGIRVSDLVLLTVNDVANGQLNYTMRKNGKKMAFPLSPKAKAIADKYIAIAEEKKRSNLFGFVKDETEDKMEVAKAIRAATSTGNNRLKKLSAELGIKKATWHAARAAFATYAVRSGMDLDTVRQMLAHSDIQTTQLYLKSRTTEELGDNLTSMMDF
jgi:integrase/recombinase XerD